MYAPIQSRVCLAFCRRDRRSGGLELKRPDNDIDIAGALQAPAHNERQVALHSPVRFQRSDHPDIRRNL